MAADYTKILDKLVRLNRGMNLKLREGTTTLDVASPGDSAPSQPIPMVSL